MAARSLGAVVKGMFVSPLRQWDWINDSVSLVKFMFSCVTCHGVTSFMGLSILFRVVGLTLL